MPPMGNAMRGSTVIPATGRRASRMIVIMGATRLLARDGNCLSSATSSSCLVPLFVNLLGIRRMMTKIVKSSPITAGRTL